MALELVKLDSETLPGIANAIRAKTGDTALLRPSEMAAAIAGIPTGGDLPELNIPAAESDVLSGKEYIDGSGNKKAGTLVVCDSVVDMETPFIEDANLIVEIESTKDGSAKDFQFPVSDALPENVVQGKNILGVKGSAKTLRVETGTITPAEDTASITIPCTDRAKAVCVEAAADVISAVEGQSEKKYVTSVAANFAGVDGAANAAMQVWYLTRYASGALTLQNTGGVTLSVSYYFYAGTYRWTAYYWEDD